MKHISDTLEFHIDAPSAITLGKFDGLHRGHQLLVSRMLQECERERLCSVVFTFDIPPKNLVEGGRVPQLLTREEKAAVFAQKGVDFLIECPFTPQVRGMEPEDFVKWIARELHVNCFVVGDDFHFGRNRRGDGAFLQTYEREFGYRTIIVPKMKEQDRVISSSLVRQEIEEGNIEQANLLLGYSYYIEGTVTHGNRLGHSIGFPTINLLPQPDKLLPPYGVYASRVHLAGEAYRGVTNIGCKPTIAGDNPVGAETYMLDFDREAYGEPVRVELIRRLRGEHKFENVEQLRAQMMQDVAAL